MAMSTKIVIRAVATQNSGLRRIARQASEARERSSLDSPPSWRLHEAGLGNGGNFSHG